ncbi:hypothetical protein ACI2KS_23090 [Pseudomonas sp. NPDC087358]|uniref:hypothetical protein n=1 Tax=Pseudomonas sp. NPDC087358 TaxID=3364439 RepID=UPI00384DC26A
MDVKSLGVSLDVGQKQKVDVDLAGAVAAYNKSGDIEDFFSQKDRALDMACKSIKTMSGDAECTVVIFAERYISRFNIFVDNFKPSDSSKHIIVRFPVFDRTMLDLYRRRLPPVKSTVIYIPYLQSESDINAQRSFFFKGIPEEELNQADNADPINIAHGYEEVVHFKVRQGN